MLLRIFCMYDSKVQAYLQPFFLKHQGEAIRGLMELVNDPKTNLYKYPEDFTLFELGTYEDTKASFTLHNTPLSIGKAIEYKNVDVPKYNLASQVREPAGQLPI